MHRNNTIWFLSIAIGLLLLFTANIIADSAIDREQIQLTDRVELEALADIDLDTERHLLPNLIDDIFSILSSEVYEVGFQESNHYTLSKPISPPKVHRTIMYRSLKIPNS